MRIASMLKNLGGWVFGTAKRDCHAKLDAAIVRSNAARQRAEEVCAGIDSDSTQRCSVDWGPSFEALSRATADDPLADVHLPLDANDVPAPDPADVLGQGYHDDDCCPDTPHPRQKDRP